MSDDIEPALQVRIGPLSHAEERSSTFGSILGRVFTDTLRRHPNATRTRSGDANALCRFGGHSSGLLVGAWFVKGGSVFTTSYQPPPSAPATVGTWVNIGPAPLSYIDNPADPANWNSGRVATIAVDPLNAESLVDGCWQWRCVGERRWRDVVAADCRFGTNACDGSDRLRPERSANHLRRNGRAPGGVGFVQVGRRDAEVDRRRAHLVAARSFDICARVGAPNSRASDQRKCRPRRDQPRWIREGQPGRCAVAPALWNSEVDRRRHFVDQNARRTGERARSGRDQFQQPIHRDCRPALVGGRARRLAASRMGSIVRSMAATRGRESKGRGGRASPSVATVGRIELSLSPSSPNVLYASIQIPPNDGPSSTGLLGLVPDR